MTSMALSEETRKHARRSDSPSKCTDGRLHAVVEARRGAAILRVLLALVALSLGVAAKAADLSPDAKREVDHLLDHLGQSGCEFNRNGTWYGAAAARSHLQMKLEHLSRRGLVSTAEEFIDRAASVSSVSGKPYQVRCGGGEAVPSKQWFQAELLRFRQERAAERP
jgi:hypothetical protein